VLRFISTPGRRATDVFEASALDIFRDFVHIDDVIDAIEAAATVPATQLPNGSVINISSGQISRVRDVVRELLDAAGHTGAIAEHVQLGARSTGVRWALGDNRRARQYLHWQPRRSLSGSLRQLVSRRD
jgi:NDP-hexose 4-ketoreductase